MRGSFTTRTWDQTEEWRDWSSDLSLFVESGQEQRNKHQQINSKVFLKWAVGVRFTLVVIKLSMHLPTLDCCTINVACRFLYLILLLRLITIWITAIRLNPQRISLESSFFFKLRKCYYRYHTLHGTVICFVCSYGTNCTILYGTVISGNIFGEFWYSGSLPLAHGNFLVVHCTVV